MVPKYYDVYFLTYILFHIDFGTISSISFDFCLILLIYGDFKAPLYIKTKSSGRILAGSVEVAEYGKYYDRKKYIFSLLNKKKNNFFEKKHKNSR